MRCERGGERSCTGKETPNLVLVFTGIGIGTARGGGVPFKHEDSVHHGALSDFVSRSPWQVPINECCDGWRRSSNECMNRHGGRRGSGLGILSGIHPGYRGGGRSLDEGGFFLLFEGVYQGADL